MKRRKNLLVTPDDEIDEALNRMETEEAKKERN